MRLARKHLTAAVLAAAFGLSLGGSLPASSSERFIVVQSTTSTQNSGLFDHLLPMFKAKSGIEVRVVAVGTGQAIKNAQNGDGDVLLVHDRASEEKFVEEGWGLKRHALMYNDFVIIGPSADPAKAASAAAATKAFAVIAAAKATFVSRGDDSGTHKAEMRLWRATGIDVKAASGTWYREVGQGMGQTINAAIGMNAYTLADRASWSAFKNKAEHKTLLEGDPVLFNQYGVILVNPARHAHTRAADGQAFVEWLLSSEGQDAIAAFKIGGEQQFFPNAKP